MDTPTMQLIAYTSLTMASVTLTVTSLYFTYRQNFGWKPLILIAQRFEKLFEIEGARFDTENYIAGVVFEVWNRRKYPISIQYLGMHFPNGEIAKGVEHYEYHTGEWMHSIHKIYLKESFRLSANEHRVCEASCIFPNNYKLLEDKAATVQMYYFDPVKTRAKTLTVPIEFRFKKKPN